MNYMTSMTLFVALSRFVKQKGPRRAGPLVEGNRGLVVDFDAAKRGEAIDLEAGAGGALVAAHLRLVFSTAE